MRRYEEGVGRDEAQEKTPWYWMVFMNRPHGQCCQWGMSIPGSLKQRLELFIACAPGATV